MLIGKTLLEASDRSAPRPVLAVAYEILMTGPNS
jgi:hypothetical protein